MSDRSPRISAETRPTPPEALGQSEAFLAFMERLSLVAKVDRPVLVLGERGTGKELAAARLHFLSSRWQGPLITLNCAALSPSLIESELFGYEPGAFTGARELRRGRFEIAHGGSLFLDEIGNMPLTAQEKVLRAVEYGSFERVGGTRPVNVDVRIIGATNRDLRAQAKRGEFKKDLLDRLSFEVLVVPPLRERTGDVMLLANNFAARMSRELNRLDVPSFSSQARAALISHKWPGNVRELKNVVERAVYRSDGRIEEIVFDPFEGYSQNAEEYPAMQPSGGSTPATETPAGTDGQKLPGNLRKAMKDYEFSLVKQAMEEALFNQAQAAEMLGLSYHQLRGIIRKHGGVKQFKS